MSKHWRMELWPDSHPKKGIVDVHSPSYPACSMYDIDEVERMFMSTPLYQRIMEKGTNDLITMSRPSQVDYALSGTYCSGYNKLVKMQGIGFNWTNHTFMQEELEKEKPKRASTSPSIAGTSTNTNTESLTK